MTSVQRATIMSRRNTERHNTSQMEDSKATEDLQFESMVSDGFQLNTLVAFVSFSSESALAEAIEELKGARLKGREVTTATTDLVEEELVVHKT